MRGLFVYWECYLSMADVDSERSKGLLVTVDEGPHSDIIIFPTFFLYNFIWHETLSCTREVYTIRFREVYGPWHTRECYL